jgi:hypothetical protein
MNTMTPASPAPKNKNSPNNASAIKPKRTIDLGIATIVAALIGGAALVGGGVLGRIIAPNKEPRPGHSTSSTKPTPGPSANKAPELIFALRSPARIPWCNSISGSGRIPDGDKLAIFDSARSTPRFYHLDGFARRTSSDTWDLTPVYLGMRHEAGLKITIAGVLVTNRTASFISSLIAGPPGKAFWVARLLPPGPSHIYLDATRTSDAHQCASRVH